ncbi:MAG TPA: TonB-dependent receptor [Terriglobia bacterium]|nr:TonB-dependent receptor [Terriglobia bacterium]
MRKKLVLSFSSATTPLPCGVLRDCEAWGVPCATGLLRCRRLRHNAARLTSRALLVAVLLFCPPAVSAQAQADRLASASLEELMSMKVTSVSRKEQKLSRAAAAIYVVTADEIRRSGATNIPDVLRMVPGLDVAQMDANSWAISARGFNNQFANKLLVLIDGRTVYDPTFSGVFWDIQNVPLEDIERIEVIRGPGAAVWGANAVNGVINIITKGSKQTQGGLVVAGAGPTTTQGMVQYGGKVKGGEGAYRVYAMDTNTGNLMNSPGQPGNDGWRQLNGGFRSDWDLSPRDSLMLEGNLLSEHGGQTIKGLLSLSPPLEGVRRDALDIQDGNLLARWSRKLSGRSDVAVQAYYDGVGHTGFFGLHENLNTLDFDFKHHFAAGDRHDIVWGLGYRFTGDQFTRGFAISFDPPKRANNLFSGFFQDEIRLTNSIQLTVGSKLEHNAYTGFEVEPDVRLLWSPSDRQAFWGAISRAIVQPSRENEDLRVDNTAFPGQGGLIDVVSLFGNPRFRAEELVAYELGYRAQASRRVSLDVATFYNVYHRLTTTEPGTPFLEKTPEPVHLVIPQFFDNKMHGNTHGAEATVTWEVAERWKISGSYSWLKMDLHLDPTSLDPLGTPSQPNPYSPAAAGMSPRHQFQVRSYLNLPRRFEFDTAFSYVDRLPELAVPSYLRVDARLGWKLGESAEFSLAGQNLLDRRHFEFGGLNLVLPTQAGRSVFAKLTWRF